VNTTSIEKLSSDIFVVVIEGTRHLAVLVSNTESSRSAKRFVEDGIAPGYVVRGENIEPWKPTGLKEIDGGVYLYGPYYEGRTIESIAEHEPKTAMSYLSRLSQALHVVHSQSLNLPHIQTNGVLFLDEGGILILPPMILERLRSVQIDEDRARTYDIYNHPDLIGEEAVVFSLAILAYRIATGELPFVGKDDLELRHLMRDYKPLTASQKNPSVRSEVSEVLASAFDGKLERPSLEAMNDHIAGFVSEGLFNNVDENEKTRAIEQSALIEERRKKAFARSRYLGRNGRTLMWSAAGLAVVIMLAGSIISNITKPRVTLEMEPFEVVELFYTSINVLDHAAIEDCVGDGVGRSEVTEATNLFVMSRMRLGNEGTTGMMDPAVWHENEDGALVDTASVYGVDRLEISTVSENRYIVEYLKWEQVLTETVPYVIPDANSTVRLRRDLLDVEFDGTYWLIVQIDRQVDRYLSIEEYEALDSE
jgi:hypothetical protein